MNRLLKAILPLLLRSVFIAGIVLGCTSSDPEPGIDNSVDSSCELIKVFRKKLDPNIISTLFHATGNGAATVFYYDLPGKTLINYTNYEYNSNGSVATRKVYDPNDVLENEFTHTYWPSGKAKQVKAERKKLETINDQTNTVQISDYDEQGGIIEYQNLNYTGSLMNHHTYTNTYSGGLLTKSVRDDLIWDIDGSTEYAYNDAGLRVSATYKDKNNVITGKTEYEYNSSDQIIEIRDFSTDDVLIGKSVRTLNANGVLMKNVKYGSNGQPQTEHTYEYECQ